MALNFPNSPAVGDLYPVPPQAGVPQYKWNGQAWDGLLVDPANFVHKTGDTMTGHLSLPITPAAPNAVRKDYVDAAIGAIPPPVAVDISGKVNKVGDHMSGDLFLDGGVLRLNSAGDRYLWWDGTRYNLNGGPLNVGYPAVGTDVATVDWVNANTVNVSGDTMTGSLTVGGEMVASGNVSANGGSLYANSVSGNCHLWLNDNGASRVIFYWERATNHVVLSTPGGTHFFQSDGRFQTAQNGGYVVRAGMNAGAGANCFNINHGAGQQLWIDLTNMGTFYFPCDYRIKKDITPMQSTWDAVKRLNPINYTNKDFTPPVQMSLQRSYGDGQEPFMKGDDTPRMGFLAHELQEELGMDAATSYKDAPDAIQSPNSLAMIAVLTKALQEAMARIEALEATR